MITTSLTTAGRQRASGWAQVKHCLGEWRRRSRFRRELATLSDGSLRDIGLDRGKAGFEPAKRFWLP